MSVVMCLSDTKLTQEFYQKNKLAEKNVQTDRKNVHMHRLLDIINS